MLRDFEKVGALVIYEEFGQDIADIAELAQRIDEKGLLYAVALDPYEPRVDATGPFLFSETPTSMRW